MNRTVRSLFSLLIMLALLISVCAFPSALATETPADTPAPTEAPAADTPAPTEAPAPTDTPAPTEAPKPTEAPAPTETPKPTETPVPTETPPLKALTKVTVQLNRTPVVMMPVSEPGSAVSSKNATLVSLTWYDKNGKAMSSADTFAFTTYRAEIRARADDGYYFTPNANGYINNSAATTTVSADGKYITVSREYTAIVWAPRVIKHPGAETIDEGNFVSYVSVAAYSTSMSWELISPDGKTVIDAKNVDQTFRNVSASINGTDKIILFNIPREMDGWQVRAVFYGALDTVTRSNPVTIKVNPDPNKPAETPAVTEEPAEESPEPSETPEETPAPEATPVQEATPVPAETPAPEATPAPSDSHEHQFSESWSSDADKHWHECECGEHSEEAAHTMAWTVTSSTGKVTEETGVCSVCGYTTTRQTSRSDANIISSIPMPLVFAVTLGLIAALVITDTVRKSRRK